MSTRTPLESATPLAPASTPAASVAAPGRDIAALIFRVVTVMMAGFVLAGPGGASYLAAPWRVVGPSDTAVSFELHRWHVTDITALVALLLAGALVACALAPRRSVAAGQSFLFAATVLAVAGLLTRDPAMILVPCGVLTSLFVATCPDRRRLLRWHRAAPWSRPAVAAAVVATPYLLFDIVQNLQLQVTDAGQHAEMGHWAIGAALSLSLLMASWVAVAGGRGARGLTAVLGVTYGYLGVAALAIPAHDGSWSTTGGLTALVAAAGFLVASGVRAREAAG